MRVPELSSVTWIRRWHGVVIKIEERVPRFHTHELAGYGIQWGSAVQSVVPVMAVAAILGWWTLMSDDLKLVGWLPVTATAAIGGAAVLVGLVAFMWGQRKKFEKHLSESIWDGPARGTPAAPSSD